MKNYPGWLVILPGLFVIAQMSNSKVPENGECCGCANWTSALKVPVPEGGSGEGFRCKKGF